MNLIKDKNQISNINNRLSSSQPFSSANNPIHLDDSGLSSEVEAIKKLRFPAISEPSTISSTSSVSTEKFLLRSSPISLDLSDLDSESSLPSLSDSEYEELEEFILNEGMKIIVIIIIMKIIMEMIIPPKNRLIIFLENLLKIRLKE
jgi:hypothetical protein